MTLHNRLVVNLSVILFLVLLMCGMAGMIGQKQADEVKGQESKIKRVVY